MKHLRLFLTLALAVLVASHGWAQTHPLASIVNGLPNPTAIHYVAPSGKAVRKGDILVVLDCLPTLAKWREIQNAIPAAEAEAKANEQKIAPTEADKAAKLAALAYEVTQADRLLHKYIEGDAPANQLSLQLAVIDAQAAYDQALSRYNTRGKLLQEGYIQKIEYDNDEVTLNRAKVALDAAKVRFDSFVNFDKPLTADSLTRTLNDKKEFLLNVNRNDHLFHRLPNFDQLGSPRRGVRLQLTPLRPPVGLVVVIHIAEQEAPLRFMDNQPDVTAYAD